MSKLTELATRRTDVFHLERKRLAIRDGFNIRTDYGDIEGYARAIRASGVKRPVHGHKNAQDEFIVTEGHRTLKAFDLALKKIDEEIRLARVDEDKAKVKELTELKKANLTLVPVMSEPQGYSDKDRTFDMLTMNDGKPLTILEEATGYQRLMKEHQVSEAEIIRVTGKSITAFQNCMMLMNEGAPAVHDAVRDGWMASTLAIELVRKVKDKQKQVEFVKLAIEKARAEGKSKATAKHLNEDVRQQVQPSKKGTAAASKASTPATPPAASPASKAPSALPNPVLGGSGTTKPAVKRELTDLVTYEIPFPAKFKLTAEVTLARVNHAAWVIGVKMKYPGAKALTGTEPDVDGDSFTSRKAAEHEALLIIDDNLKAAQRTDKKTFTKAQWDDLLDVSKKLAKKAGEEAQEAPADALPDDDGQESLVPEAADATPAEHILALRDKLKGDKRMKKKLGAPAFIALNFIADYLQGGRYEAGQFEKFFTEFVITGKQ